MRSRNGNDVTSNADAALVPTVIFPKPRGSE